MSEIKYIHARNVHSRSGADRGFSYFQEGRDITSLLDVGAGIGTWLLAAQSAGVSDIFGVDGVRPPLQELCVPPDLILQVDLRQPLSLGRKFDAALCLEVAEHLPEASAATLVSSICNHADLVFFSAATPGQHGENHVNCQPPAYWQAIFNACGFVCLDEIRDRIWDDKAIEPWYRQNVFIAVRDPEHAGAEPRLRYLIHPAMIECTNFPNSPLPRRLEAGIFSPLHYLRLLLLSIGLRLRRTAGFSSARV
jgi:hypothetical protein